MLTATAEIDPDISTERITVRSDYRSKDAVKACPGARWDTKARVWTVPLSWPACLALRNEFGKGLTIGPKLRAWAKAVGEIKKYTRERRVLMELPVGEALPELPAFGPLFSHQRVDADLIAWAHRYLIGNETGTGKTRSALAGMSLLNNAGHDIFPLLIVAPTSVVINWGREAKPFFPDNEIRVVQGTPTKIRKALEPGADIYVIGWDALRRYSRLAAYGSVALKRCSSCGAPTGEDVKEAQCEAHPKELQALAPRAAIIDEIHRAKNPQSKRTRAAWAATSTCEYVVGMTGTPMQDTPEDMFGPLRTVFPAEYPTKTSYVERYLETDWNMWGGRDVIGIHPKTAEEFFANFDANFRRVTKEMALPFLPPKLYEVRWVTLPPAHRKVYRDMENRMVAELEDSTMTAENALVKAGRLIQLANALGEMDEDGRFHMTGDSPKVKAFLADVAEGDFDGQQVVVFTDSVELLGLLQAEMDEKKIEYVTISGAEDADQRQAAMDSFQKGEVPFCLLTRAGGEGITLTAASTMVRLMRPWSFIVHTQVEDRVHRIGSEVHESIAYIDYLTEDTLEEGQMVRLNAKEARSQEVLRDDELLSLLKKGAS